MTGLMVRPVRTARARPAAPEAGALPIPACLDLFMAVEGAGNGKRAGSAIRMKLLPANCMRP